MYQYSGMQWLLFFYVYCVFGWCFESTYVSLKKRKFVNRGFLNGPFLPIYGTGAITILFITLPVQKWPVAVYFAGALAATVLEYITGELMEALFKVRYWDYSEQKLNYKGHICLSSSIAWGFLSLFAVYIFQRPLEKFVFAFPEKVLIVFVYVVTIILVIDCTLSFKTAFELRDVLVKLEEAKAEFKRLQRRLEIVEAFLEDEKNQMLEDKRAQFAEEMEMLREKQALAKARLRGHLAPDKLRMLRRNPSAISVKYQKTLEEYRNRVKDLDLEEWKEKFNQLRLESIKEGLTDIKEDMKEGFAEMKEDFAEMKENARENFAEMKENARENFAEMREDVKEGFSEFREDVKEGLAEMKENVKESILEGRASGEKEDDEEK